MADKRIIDFSAETGIQATDLLLLSDPSANYTKITMQQLINFMSANLSAPKRAICDTAADTASKAVTISNYAAIGGRFVTVTFTNDVLSGAALSINAIGNVPIYYHGQAITDGVINAGDTALFVYNAAGANATYDLITVDRAEQTGSELPALASGDIGKLLGVIESNGVLSWGKISLALAMLGCGYANDTVTSTTDTTRNVDITGYQLTTGGLLVVRFPKAVPANAKLSINSANAKDIYYQGAKITSGTIPANTNVLMYYNGAAWHVLITDRALLQHQSLPEVRYFVSETAYNNGAASVATGDYIYIGDGPISLYRKTSTGRTLICTFPAGSDSGSTGGDTWTDVTSGYTESGMSPVNFIAAISASGKWYFVAGTDRYFAEVDINPSDNTKKHAFVRKLSAGGISKIEYYYNGVSCGGIEIDTANHKITPFGLADPTRNTDAATKAYVDGLLGAKILSMSQSGNTYTYTGANFTFNSLDGLITMAQAGTMLWLVNTSTGSAYRCVNARGATSLARLTFAGPTLERDDGDLNVEAFVINASMQITKKVLSASSGGISKLTVTIRSSSGGYVSSHSPSEIAAARSNGDVVEVDCSGIDGWITGADASGASALSIAVDGGTKSLEMWSINQDKSVVLLTQDIGDAYKPVTETLNGATPTISYALNNMIYKGGTLTSLTVNNLISNGMFMLIFDSGSTPTNLVLPEYDAQHPAWAYVKKPGGFTIEANKHYELSINAVDGVGYLVGQGW